jgi:hypothetical protein
MTADRDAFLVALRADPADATARGVFAAWLGAICRQVFAGLDAAIRPAAEAFSQAGLAAIQPPPVKAGAQGGERPAVGGAASVKGRGRPGQSWTPSPGPPA